MQSGNTGKNNTFILKHLQNLLKVLIITARGLIDCNVDRVLFNFFVFVHVVTYQTNTVGYVSVLISYIMLFRKTCSFHQKI